MKTITVNGENFSEQQIHECVEAIRNNLNIEVAVGVPYRPGALAGAMCIDKESCYWRVFTGQTPWDAVISMAGILAQSNPNIGVR